MLTPISLEMEPATKLYKGGEDLQAASKVTCYELDNELRVDCERDRLARMQALIPHQESRAATSETPATTSNRYQSR